MMHDNMMTVRSVLLKTRTLAIVGLSDDWYRPSYFAAKYMQEHGYRVIPVNPRYERVLGEKCYPTLSAIPETVDLVDVFRKPSEAPGIAREAVAIGAKVLWLQIGVINDEARTIAETAGLTVIMDRCVKIEHARLFGGLNWFGVNTHVISSRRLLRFSPPKA
ncbi:CoA-binding protein [Ectothiorhodospira lacustris]|uniref:CoA-binding protein n=1 Tax=Ectothiorhodospira lacustris TaxID=2899127 RepID=UPI003242497D|nr:CoA-binding protein [Ectothiorhodospira lacustris]